MKNRNLSISLIISTIALSACVGSSPSSREIKKAIENLAGSCNNIFEISNIEKKNGIKVDDSRYQIDATFKFSVLPQKDIEQISNKYNNAAERSKIIYDEMSEKLKNIKQKHADILNNYTQEREKKEQTTGLGDPAKAYEEHGDKIRQLFDAKESEEKNYRSSISNSIDEANAAQTAAFDELQKALKEKLGACQTPYESRQIFAETLGLFINKSSGKFESYYSSEKIYRLSKSLTEGLSRDYTYDMKMIKSDNGWISR